MGIEVLWSEPGSDIMSETVAQLDLWFGVRRAISLVDRHESDGVEGVCKLELYVTLQQLTPAALRLIERGCPKKRRVKKGSVAAHGF